MIKGWVVKVRYGKDCMDGPSEHLELYDYQQRYGKRGNHNILLFTTRAEARAYCKERWGYLARRDDLRRYPHGWLPSVVVRATMEVKELK